MSDKNKLERGRAKFAFERAEIVERDYKNISGSYKTYVKRMPMLIKTNGLGAALAFSFSKRTTEKTKSAFGYNLLYDDIAEWLKQDEKKLVTFSKNEDLVRAVVSLDSSEYRAVTIEVLAFLDWLRRFAEGLIEKEEEDA